MSPCLVLLQDGLVALAIDVMDGGRAAGIEEILRLVEIFLFPRQGIETRQCHLGNLVSRHYLVLTGVGTHFPDHAVGIPLGDVKELGAARSLVMGAGGIHHVAEIIELVAQYLHHAPSLVARPSVWMSRIDGAGGVEVAVWLLCCTHHVKHTVDVSHHFLVGIGLEDVAGSLDGLVHVGVVEGESHELAHVPLRRIQTRVTGMLQGIGSHLEVLVAMLALTFGECQGHRRLARRLQSVSPEGIGSNLHAGKGDLGKGIAIVQHILRRHRQCRGGSQ